MARPSIPPLRQFLPDERVWAAAIKGNTDCVRILVNWSRILTGIVEPDTPFDLPGGNTRVSYEGVFGAMEVTAIGATVSPGMFVNYVSGYIRLAATTTSGRWATHVVVAVTASKVTLAKGFSRGPVFIAGTAPTAGARYRLGTAGYGTIGAYAPGPNSYVQWLGTVESIGNQQYNCDCNIVVPANV